MSTVAIRKVGDWAAPGARTATAARATVGLAVVVAVVVAWACRWVLRHWRWSTGWGLFGLLGGDWSVWLATVLAPALVCAVWARRWPVGYERLVAGPARRIGWRWRIRRQWIKVAEACGLDRSVRAKHWRTGEPVTKAIVPRIRRVRATGATVTLTLRPRPGQTVEDLIERADRIAATYGAETFRAFALGGTTVAVELTMADLLITTSFGREPEPRVDRPERVGLVPLGLTQAGRHWVLRVTGRHTLCAGASGSGKGSVLWGICCALAPAVKVDMVRLWGIDLKGGVEVETGAGLFSARAYAPEAAVQVLRRLHAVVEARTALMRGQARDFVPSIGDPLHVLVIDELAVLVAYTDPEIRREAERRLAHLLAVGRAVGVVVVAFVQDPRKEVVAMRNLFNQRIALRLITADETTMVLGDGMARLAPAHRINPDHPGTGWLVDETGAVDRVRAHYWTDQQIRDLARRYATEVHLELDTDVPAYVPAEAADSAVPRVDLDKPSRPERPDRQRSPRKARKLREPRDTGEAVGTAGGAS